VGVRREEEVSMDLYDERMNPACEFNAPLWAPAKLLAAQEASVG
jgi:hypothetical protein